MVTAPALVIIRIIRPRQYISQTFPQMRSCLCFPLASELFRFLGAATSFSPGFKSPRLQAAIFRSTPLEARTAPLQTTRLHHLGSNSSARFVGPRGTGRPPTRGCRSVEVSQQWLRTTEELSRLTYHFLVFFQFRSAPKHDSKPEPAGRAADCHPQLRRGAVAISLALTPRSRWCVCFEISLGIALKWTAI